MPKLEYDDLVAMPTLHSGHWGNVKINTTEHGGKMSVTVSRCGIKDGEREPVTVEILENGVWVNPMDELDNPKVSVYKDFIIDAGPYKGFKITVLRRNEIRSR